MHMHNDACTTKGYMHNDDSEIIIVKIKVKHGNSLILSDNVINHLETNIATVLHYEHY